MKKSPALIENKTKSKGEERKPREKLAQQQQQHLTKEKHGKGENGRSPAPNPSKQRACAYKINKDLEPFLVPIGELKHDPENIRLHPKRNIAVLVNSLEANGQQKPVVHDNGVVVAGNGLLAAAVKLGWSHIAAVPFQGATAQLRQFKVQDNRSGELSYFDLTRLGRQLGELNLPLADMAGMGFDGAEVEAIMAGKAWEGMPDGTNAGHSILREKTILVVTINKRERQAEIVRGLKTWAKKWDGVAEVKR